MAWCSSSLCVGATRPAPSPVLVPEEAGVLCKPGPAISASGSWDWSCVQQRLPLPFFVALDIQLRLDRWITALQFKSMIISLRPALYHPKTPLIKVMPCSNWRAKDIALWPVVLMSIRHNQHSPGEDQN